MFKRFLQALGLLDFEYQPLQPDGDQIRLLYVHPAETFDDEITCELRTVNLSQRPEYAALSYVWGPPVFDRKISLNGHAFSITASLEYALKQFRTTGLQMLWADAICIDQTNTKERSQQVQLMRQIYSQALEVLISLGDGGPGICKVIKLITQVFQYKQLLRPGQNVGAADIVRLRQSPGWTELNELLKHPWFLRTWVFQEAVVSPKGTVMFNKAFLSLPFFCGMVILAHVINSILSGSKSVKEIQDLRHGAHSTVGTMLRIRNCLAGWPLIRLLHALRPQSATDPRDKIYGALGIASDRVHFPSPDYEKSVEVVYLEYAQALVTEQTAGGAIGMLLSAAGLQYQQRDLPSWVPDWSNPVDAYGRSFINKFYVKKSKRIPSHSAILIDTEFSLTALFPVKVELHDDRPTLTIRGFVEDSILDLGPEVKGTSKESWLDYLSAWDEESGGLVMEYAAVLVQQYAGLSDSGPEQVTRHMFGRYASVVTGNVLECQEPERTRQYSSRALEAYIAFAKLSEEVPIGNTELSDASVFVNALLEFGTGRRLCVTKNGRLGLVPGCSAIGDVISVLDGVLCHMILRRRDNAYVLVGDACMEGPLPSLNLAEHASEFEDIAIQ